MEDKMKSVDLEKVKADCFAATDSAEVFQKFGEDAKKIARRMIITLLVSMVVAAICYYYGAPLIAVAIGLGIGLTQAEGHFRSQMDKLNEELEARFE